MQLSLSELLQQLDDEFADIQREEQQEQAADIQFQAVDRFLSEVQSEVL